MISENDTGRLNHEGKLRFSDQLRGNRKQIIEIIVLALLNTGSKITLSFAMGWFVNGAVSRQMLLVVKAGVIAMASLALGYGLTVTLSATQLEITKRIQKRLKRNIYRVVLYQNVQTAEELSWQKIFNLTENSIPTLASDYFGNTLANVSRFIQIILCSGALIFVNVDIFFLFLVVSAVPFFLNPIIRKQFGRYKVRLNERTMQHMSLATSVLKGLTTIRAFSGSSLFEGQLQQLDNHLEEQRKQSKLWDVRISQLSTLLAMSAQIVCMLIAALFILRGIITIGDLTVTTQLLNFIVPTITAFNTAYLIGVATQPLQADYQEILQLKANQPTQRFINGDIVVKHLGYAYAQGNQIFKDFSVQVIGGTKTAILGRSGCGKSTLMKIIAGELTAYTGSVTIGGISIKEIDPVVFHRNVVYVNQTPDIFGGTVLENVTMFGAIQSTQTAKVMQQLNLAQMSDRQIVNGDVELSGGERQRISLARALLVAAPILIIDEPDSGQDPTTASTIQNLIFSIRARTVIVVTHNWQSAYLQHFNCIVRLESL